MVFSEPKISPPKKRSVLFQRGLESGCRNFDWFRRPFLLGFCRVNNFFFWFLICFVCLILPGVLPVVTGPVTLAKVSGRDPARACGLA